MFANAAASESAHKRQSTSTDATSASLRGMAGTLPGASTNKHLQDTKALSRREGHPQCIVQDLYGGGRGIRHDKISLSYGQPGNLAITYCPVSYTHLTLPTKRIV